MLVNKYRLGQEVDVFFDKKFRSGKIVGMDIVDSKIQYRVAIESIDIDIDIRKFTSLRKTGIIKRFENEIRPPKHMCKENKTYDNTESEEKIKKIFGADPISTVRVLKIELEEDKVILYYTNKGEFKPKLIVSKCHPDDAFNEDKGIMACVIKCQIEVLKRMLRNI